MSSVDQPSVALLESLDLQELTDLSSASSQRCRRDAASVFIVMHIGDNNSVLPSLLANAGHLPAEFAQDGAMIRPGHIYVAPPNRHMLLTLTAMRLNSGPKVHHTRPAADPLFISAAKIHGPRVVGIVLSGGGGDGVDGLKTIKECSGTALVQRPDEAAQLSMPYAAIMADHPDAVLSITDLADRVRMICS